MKYLLVLFLSIFYLVLLPCSRAVATNASISVTYEPVPVQAKTKVQKGVKWWKIQKKRHKNPAPIFLVVALVAAAAAIAVYFLTPMVAAAAALGGIAFIAFILYFVYSGAN